MESLLTSYSTFLYNQIKFIANRESRKVGGPIGADTIPQCSHEITIYSWSSVFARTVFTVVRSLWSYSLYGSAVVRQYGSTVGGGR